MLCALFSGHLLAHRQGHEYFPVQVSEQQLLHEADSDELSQPARGGRRRPARTSLRWQDDRKPRASCQ
ncbi:YncJ family protein [Klebsiella pneumoniae subsp. pneumoniae]|nr:YncJ family protein [Klebsiella pneumoniae subsp. pneumoniae]